MAALNYNIPTAVFQRFVDSILLPPEYNVFVARVTTNVDGGVAANSLSKELPDECPANLLIFHDLVYGPSTSGLNHVMDHCALLHFDRRGEGWNVKRYDSIWVLDDAPKKPVTQRDRSVYSSRTYIQQTLRRKYSEPDIKFAYRSVNLSTAVVGCAMATLSAFYRILNNQNVLEGLFTARIPRSNSEKELYAELAAIRNHLGKYTTWYLVKENNKYRLNIQCTPHGLFNKDTIDVDNWKETWRNTTIIEILNVQLQNDIKHYLVKHRDYKRIPNAWVPETQLVFNDQLIASFNERIQRDSAPQPSEETHQ